MSTRAALAAWLMLLLTSLGLAQQGGDFERIELRVISAQNGQRIGVDHGSSDGLGVGDMVLFFPRDGGTFSGSVVDLSERGATVELHDRGVELALGTRGQALVSRASEPEASPAAPTEELADLPWSNLDEDWNQSMPLLTQSESVRPADRRKRVRGRVYAISDLRYTSFEDRRSDFTRFGQEVTYENPFGRGGGLQVDVEESNRLYSSKDGEGEQRNELRIDRLSYFYGGDRFDPTRVEGGRFLQDGMPEFGVIDGAEIGHRRENGDHFGISAGYMPEPFDNFQSGEDAQLAAFYRWVADEDERFSLAGGYQKSWHNDVGDRDLFLAKGRYLPEDAWQYQGTAWIDRSGANDEAKDNFSLTQAIAMAQRRWRSGNGLSVTYNRTTFPEIERQEFLTLAPAQLAHDHSDRLSLRAWRLLSEDRKLHGQVAGWSDEDADGADGELGLELRDFLIDEGRTDLTVFGTDGRFESILGARVTLSGEGAGGGWSLMYEASRVDVQGGLLSPGDDLFQHRLRANRDLYTDGGWVLSAYAESFLWDEEDAWLLGFHVQRSF